MPDRALYYSSCLFWCSIGGPFPRMKLYARLNRFLHLGSRWNVSLLRTRKTRGGLLLTSLVPWSLLCHRDKSPSNRLHKYSYSTSYIAHLLGSLCSPCLSAQRMSPDGALPLGRFILILAILKHSFKNVLYLIILISIWCAVAEYSCNPLPSMNLRSNAVLRSKWWHPRI